MLWVRPGQYGHELTSTERSDMYMFRLMPYTEHSTVLSATGLYLARKQEENYIVFIWQNLYR